MEKVKLNWLHDGSVAQVILDDGKGNVIDNIMMLELLKLFAEFKTNNNLKLIVFEGAGKHFSFGASVEEHQKDFAAAMLQTFHKMFFTLRDMSIPTVAKISGQCLGGGLELALMCSVMFADKTAKLGQPEVVLGVFPPPASVILPERIGLARSEEMLLTGRSITADEAKTFGLVTEVFETRNDLDSGVEDWIQKHILPKSAVALQFAEKAVRAKFNHILSNFLPALEAMYLRELMNTHDANEGIQSFVEKRKPEWTNN